MLSFPPILPALVGRKIVFVRNTVPQSLRDVNYNSRLITTMIMTIIIKYYNFLACDWFKKDIFSTNSLAKLLSDSLLLNRLLSDSSKRQSHSKIQFKSTNHIQSCNYVLCARALAFVFLSVALECLSLFCQYFNANFPHFSKLGYFSFSCDKQIGLVRLQTELDSTQSYYHY